MIFLLEKQKQIWVRPKVYVGIYFGLDLFPVSRFAVHVSGGEWRGGGGGPGVEQKFVKA